MESQIEKDFKEIAALISEQMIATGGVNPNAFNALSQLHGQVMAAWFNCRPPPAP